VASGVIEKGNDNVELTGASKIPLFGTVKIGAAMLGAATNNKLSMYLMRPLFYRNKLFITTLLAYP
jgi:hypothetical protein